MPPPLRRPVVPPRAQIRASASSAPELVGGGFERHLQGASKISTPGFHRFGYYDIPIGVMYLGANKLQLRFPVPGRWEIGLVQNVVIHRGNNRYDNGRVSWFVGVPLLDVLSDATDVWCSTPDAPGNQGKMSPVIVTTTTIDEVVTVPDFEFYDSPMVHFFGMTKCGGILESTIDVFFRAGLLARRGKDVFWIATSTKDYGFSMRLSINVNGDYDFGSDPQGTLDGMLQVPPGPPLELNPPVANRFVDNAIKSAFHRAGCSTI
ncbi:hypothetical protein [Sorangium sp. So ce131]|uniref:hypothetical protein n=1 Tax=Sorangium sp. So ce131 TaxID=3133282 RepID=UPI003F63F062